jgi:hypothetical protein
MKTMAVVASMKMPLEARVWGESESLGFSRICSFGIFIFLLLKLFSHTVGIGERIRKSRFFM